MMIFFLFFFLRVMALRILSISEALKLLDELPSDNESEFAKSSDTEDYAAKLGDGSDITSAYYDD